MGQIVYGEQELRNTGFGAVLLAALLALIPSSSIASTVATLIYGPPPYPPIFDVRALQFPLRIAAGLFTLGGLTLLTLALKGRGGDLMLPGSATFMVLAVLTALLSRVPFYGPEPVFHMILRSGARWAPQGLLFLAISYIAVFTVIMSVIRKGFVLRPTHSRGSNTWGEGRALMQNKTGIILGERNGRFLRYNGDGHLLTVAATRSGKGVSGIIPNLLEYPGSVIVSDPKGENFWITARWRATHHGQRCVALDPFGIVGEKIEELRAKLPPEMRDRVVSGSFNPLDLMHSDDPNLVDLAKMFADMLVPKGATKEPFWEIEAAGVIEGFLLYLATTLEPGDPERSMLGVRHLLTQSADQLADTLEEMQESPMREVREAANRILQKAEKELSGVLSTAHSHTHFLASPAMERVLARSNFDMTDLLTGKLSVYLVLPAEFLQPFARWLRLMFACAYWVCTKDATRRGGISKRVLFLMEEFANLGRLEFMNSVISLGAGYGVTVWMILQDLSQLKREYEKEWESFLANVDVIQAFGISDSFTAEQISKLIGETTVLSKSFSPKHDKGLLIDRYSVSYSETNRPLLRPDELRRLHPDDLILLVRSLNPVIARKVRYYQHRYFDGKWDPNPLHTKKATVVPQQTVSRVEEEDPFAF